MFGKFQHAHIRRGGRRKWVVNICLTNKILLSGILREKICQKDVEGARENENPTEVEKC